MTMAHGPARHRAPFRRLRIDPFLLILIGAVALAWVMPVREEAARIYDTLTDCAIALLFFSQGTKLPREAVLRGVAHWRLHLVVLSATFILFPLLGIAISTISMMVLPIPLTQGLLYLCLLPSTVQSSIAFTAIARGNVAAAICSASLSNVLGIFLTPLLVAALMQTGGSPYASWGAIGSICTLILLPFGAGHLSRPWTSRFADRHRSWIGRIDRGSIIMVVYGAFSASVVARFWSTIEPFDLLLVAILCALILGIALVVTTATARHRKFDHADEIAIVFCGSKKSLASGVPIASALFPASMLGGILLPLMIFHQLQLFACSVLARRYEKSFDNAQLATRSEAPTMNAAETT